MNIRSTWALVPMAMILLGALCCVSPASGVIVAPPPSPLMLSLLAPPESIGSLPESIYPSPDLICPLPTSMGFVPDFSCPPPPETVIAPVEDLTYLEEIIVEPEVFSPPSEDITLSPEEQEFINLINRERDQRNLAALEVAPILVQVAREHSEEMARLDYFDHLSPTPGQRTPMARLRAKLPGDTQPRALATGENIYYCSVVDVSRGHRALMDSPPHREALLSPYYQQVGVGIWKSPDGRFWVTQMFMSITL